VTIGYVAGQHKPLKRIYGRTMVTSSIAPHLQVRILTRQWWEAGYDFGSYSSWLGNQGALFFPRGDRIHLCLDVVVDRSSSLKAVTAL
jgi:hypothetical protein